MARDYLGMIKPKDGDRLDYGVRGMKWGVRRTSAQLKAGPASSGGSNEHNAGIKAANGEESSAERYSRLKAQAKGGGASSMSDTDLKFFNARTEAVAKVNKLNETKPGWLHGTTKTVLQMAAQKQMQAIADSIASKYISDPLISALKDNSGAIAAESKTPVNYLGKHRAKK